METPVNREIFSAISFYYFFFYWLFLLYLPITEKLLVLIRSNLRSHETRQVLDPRKMTKAVVA